VGGSKGGRAPHGLSAANARGRRLLADSEGGTFENLAFLPRHAQRLRLGSRANHVFGPQSEPAAMTLGP